MFHSHRFSFDELYNRICFLSTHYVRNITDIKWSWGTSLGWNNYYQLVFSKHVTTFSIFSSRYNGHKTGDYYIECGVDNTDTYVFSGSTDGAIWCWDLVKLNPVNQLIHNDKAVLHSLSVHPNKPAIISASGQTIKVWGSSESTEEEDSWVSFQLFSVLTIVRRLLFIIFIVCDLYFFF